MAALYLTNVKNISNLPEQCVKLLITRKQLQNMNGINWVLSLAPSEKLFWDYKNDIISWKEYEKRYKKELKYNYRTLLKIKTFVDNDVNIALICYCEDYNYCHRRLIGEKLEQMGVKVVYG